MSKISIIIPAYNAASFLREAIDSVLAQKCKSEIEVIVVDDGSTDETASVVVGDSRVFYKYQQNQGQAVARNLGLANCTGDYIGFLDADDLFIDGALRVLEQALEQDSQLTAVFGCLTEFIDESGASSQHRVPVVAKPTFSPGTTLMRRELVEKIGLFDASLRLGEFVDWISRARAAGMTELLLSDVVLKRRLHKANFGLKVKANLTDHARVAHAHLKRRRAVAPISL